MADFTDLLRVMRDDVVAHADAEGLTGLKRAVFIARGGHAVGESCALAIQSHAPECVMSGEDRCVCAALAARGE